VKEEYTVGQKVNPLGFRLGVYRFWDSRWFARNSYGEFLMDDLKVRKYLDSQLESAEISQIEIERAGETVRVVIHSARPGAVIGKRGQEIDELRKNLATLFKANDVDISVQEVRRPEMDAMLVAKNIATQLERRANYKRAMKRAAAMTLKSGAKGIKICCGGRLGGAEIARKEWLRVGSIPLHTLRSDVDYGFAEAKTTYGIIGVKVWICKGEYQLV
jgi:small subunit ribosomal protein S3